MAVKKTTTVKKNVKAAKSGKPGFIKARKSDPKFDVYKKLLLQMKDQIVGDIQHLSDQSSGSSNDRSGDDVATDMYDREFMLGLASNDRELLSNIAEALTRIQDGNYGLCIKCQKAIPAMRLKALPHTQTCLKCQEALELKQR